MLSGCDPSLVTVEISTTEAKSQILVYVEGDRIVEVYGVDNPADRTQLSIPRRPGAQVYSIDYSCPLSGAGLKAGPISVDSQGVSLRRPLRVRQGSGARMEAGAWTTVMEPPPLISGVKLTGTRVSPCSRYDSLRINLERDAMGAALVGTDRSVVVLRTSAGFERFYTRTGQALLPPLALPAGAPRALFSGATITDGAGVAYFFSRKGDFFRVGPDGEVSYSSATTTSTLPRSTSATARVAGPPSGDLLSDLFMVTEQGRVDHFDGSAWTAIVPPTTGQVGLHSAGIVWLGAGSALAVGQRGNEALFIQGTTQRLESVYPPSSVLLVTAADLSPLYPEPAVLTDDGNVWLRRSETGYAPLPLEDFRDGRLEVHAAFRHQLLFLHGGHTSFPAAHSYISQYDEELGSCETDVNDVTPFTNPITALRLPGGDLMIYGVDGNETKPQHLLLRLTRVEGPVRCDGTPEVE